MQTLEIKEPSVRFLRCKDFVQQRSKALEEMERVAKQVISGL